MAQTTIVQSVSLKYGQVELVTWSTEHQEHIKPLANNVKVWNNLRDRFPRPYTDDCAKFWVTQGSRRGNAEGFPYNLAILYEGKLVSKHNTHLAARNFY